MVDATGSMGQSLDRLASAVRTIAEVLSELGKHVEVQIIAYRDELVTEMPITKIERPGDDQGESLSKLDQVLGSLEAVGGKANLPLAIERSLEEGEAFDGLDDLADQDCREAAIQLKQGTPAAVEDRVVDNIVRWASQPGSDRRVVSFFSESQTPDAKAFFERVADETPGGLFSEDVMGLMRTVMAEVLPGAK